MIVGCRRRRHREIETACAGTVRQLIPVGIPALVPVMLSVALFANMLFATPTGAQAGETVQSAPELEVTRIGGVDRHDTSRQLLLRFSELSDAAADTVILVSGYSWTDAVIANGLAGVLDTPILLTGDIEPVNDVLDAMKSAGARKAIIVGAETVLLFVVVFGILGLAGLALVVHHNCLGRPRRILRSLQKNYAQKTFVGECHRAGTEIHWSSALNGDRDALRALLTESIHELNLEDESRRRKQFDYGSSVCHSDAATEVRKLMTRPHFLTSLNAMITHVDPSNTES